jgi:hypothetical protein
VFLKTLHLYIEQFTITGTLFLGVSLNRIHVKQPLERLPKLSPYGLASGTLDQEVGGQGS